MYQPFEALLAERIGLDPVTVGRDEIGRAVRSRMREAAATDAGHYLSRVREDREEFDELAELVLVPETWFFREPGAFAWLAGRAKAHLASGRAAPLRVLSIPCASGEEPYSIAITLLEAGVRPGYFTVDAVDLSRRALSRASHATYGPRSMRHVDVLLRARHFDARDDEFRLRRDAADTVSFRRGNLVDPGVLATEAPYDVVFCRNVLIYFDQPARARVLATLGRLVGDAGVLLTGHAEGQAVVAPLFESAKIPGVFAYTRAGVRGKHAAAGAVRRAASGGIEPRRLASPDRHAAAQGSTGVPLARPPVMAQRSSTASAGDEGQLEAIRALADRGQLDEALAKCRAWLASRPASADAHYLLGVLELSAGRRAEAETALRKATYLDPGHAEALLHLALERARQGDTREAELLQRRAARARRHGVVS